MNADKILYSLIYGESMLNDAISISSYKYNPAPFTFNSFL